MTMSALDYPGVWTVMTRSDRDPAEDRYREVVRALCRAPGVSVGSSGANAGFGANALRIDNRIFAMLDSRRRFVVKLPRERVAELIGAGVGEPFDAGRDRVMKEWAVIPATSTANWLAVAREAMRFVARAQPPGDGRMASQKSGK